MHYRNKTLQINAGDERHPGIIPRAMEDVFRTKSASEKCSVSAYMLELYQVISSQRVQIMIYIGMMEVVEGNK